MTSSLRSGGVRDARGIKAPSPVDRPPHEMTARANLERDLLASIERRVLWLATRMIHEANHVRPNRDGVKVGGHQASSASVVSILTALYFAWLRAPDLVSIKPHASPVFHAIQYLLGNLDRSYLTTLRAFGGLQAYPSRTKDPDDVDFSTGSVGLGAMAPLFAGLAERYVRLHGLDTASGRERRFVALVGDAELDEGSVWEAILENALGGLGNVTVIVDLNRQSLDRVVPGVRVRRLEAMYAAAGWQVLEAKYGARLRAIYDGPGGDVLRRRLDDMSNEEYQAMLRRPPADIRARLTAALPARSRSAIKRALRDHDDDALPSLLADLGGHDIPSLLGVLEQADADASRPAVVFAYTIKGWGLPFAGDALNHSALMSPEQIGRLADDLGVDADDPWAGFPIDSREGRLCRERGAALSRTPSVAGAVPSVADPNGVRIAAMASTQQVFGDSLAALARDPELGRLIVTASPDVAVSTSLGGWINRVGVFSIEDEPVVDDTPRPLRWAPQRIGQHVELGISEMNLFLWLSQFGLARSLFGVPLVPIGTVYDPFVLRGLDALIYALYVGARFILAATPSGVTLAPEGGAHQSTITPSVTTELPNLRAYEPAFGQEVPWLLGEAIRLCLAPSGGASTILRLSTRPVDQSLAEAVRNRVGEDAWRAHVIAGGYRLIEPDEVGPDLPATAPLVTVVAMGTVVTEAAEAVRALIREEVRASLVVVTSPDRLSAELHESRIRAVRDRINPRLKHLDVLFPEAWKEAPMVTVLDGASHTLSFLGAVHGVPVVPLGVDTFGQSGDIGDLYAYAGIDREHIFEAALLALDIAGRL